MAEIFATPRGSNKTSRLPRAVGKTNRAPNLSARIEFTSPVAKQALIKSKIPLSRTNSEKGLAIKSEPLAAKSATSITKFEILSLEFLSKFNEKSLATQDKNRIIQMTREIPRVWIDVVQIIAMSRNEMVNIVVNEQFDSVLEISTERIKQKIDEAKSATTKMLSQITNGVEDVLTKLTETEKLQRTVKSQTLKITSLSADLKKIEAAQEQFKKETELEKIELEKKIVKASNSNRGLQSRLKEKTEALEKKKQSAVEVDELKKDVPVAEGLAALVENAVSGSGEEKLEVPPEQSKSRKQIRMLKETVRKLEKMVSKLSKQNENLRMLYSNAERRASVEESQMLEKNVGYTLKKILHEKQRNLDKLMAVVDLIRDHHSASRDQRSQLEARVDVLRSRCGES